MLTFVSLRTFEKSLAEFQRCRVPELLTLLRKNSIADPEKLLLELVEDKIKELAQ